VKIDAAWLLMRTDCLEAQRVYEEGGTLELEARLRYKRNAAQAARWCVEAVDTLHEMAGANGIYDSYPLQRVFRDMRAAAGHISFSVDAQLAPWGLVQAGGEFRSPTL
jgi:3-hydroxy-9,10-secoandrosta-1,3,5(10)-triene-9,17-dione monooxygenase